MLGKLVCKGAIKNRFVDIVFIDDRQIAALALRFRKSPGPTDVLAFAYDDDDLSGEVAVSVDTAFRQAKERKVCLSNELALLCVHGMFHIAGLGDETYKDWCRMRVREFETMMKIL